MDSDWFKGRLRERKRTQEHLAVAIHRERSVVSKIINGKQPLQIDEVRGFSEVLEVPVIEILYRAGLWNAAPSVVLAPIINSVEAGEFADTTPDEPPSAEHSIVVERACKTVFALKIEGDSMDRVAPENSLIVVNYSVKKAKDGELFVFRRHGEATFKRFRKDESGAWLEPDSTNPRHTRIFPDNGDNIEVIGRVIEIRPEYG
ncbi:hypothetical protein LCGC14_2388180, partial [marine sediment metagenome]